MREIYVLTYSETGSWAGTNTIRFVLPEMTYDEFKDQLGKYEVQVLREEGFTREEAEDIVENKRCFVLPCDKEDVIVVREYAEEYEANHIIDTNLKELGEA